MHELPDDNLSDTLALSVSAANRIHLDIQNRIRAIVRAPSMVVATAFTEQLAPLYQRLAIVEATLWREVSTQVAEADSNAEAVARMLSAPEPDFAALSSCAAHVSTALSSMTSLQRDAMLAKPSVALANNIAMDCMAEFDDETALARWRGQLAEVGQDQIR